MRASAVFIECIQIFWIVILDSLRSMLKAKAFLRDTSTGLADALLIQSKYSTECRSIRCCMSVSNRSIFSDRGKVTPCAIRQL